MPSDIPSQTVNTRYRTLALCWVFYGVTRLLMAVWLLGFSATATLMFGALLTRVPNPFTLMGDFHFIYLVVIIWSAVAGVLGIVAGVGLLANQSFSRALALMAAFFSLSEIPLGLTLGTYTLVVLLPADAVRRPV